MIRNLIFTIPFVFLSIAAFPQKENNIWYFGNGAGVDFNSGSPVALTNGQINTTEGCASIADVNGNLLFYTDGVTVWNSNHSAMPNGNGLFGGASSSQSALILPFPGSVNIYYIFTAPQSGSNNPLSYSIVDMTLSVGLGDITLKNIALQSNVTEKLHAVRHTNGTDFWIVCHGLLNTNFYSYLLSSTGVSALPVINSIGLSHNDNVGQIKISPGGNKLATTLNITSEVELFDFDNQTGIISNPVTFLGIMANPYGLEFSPDNTRLYVAEAGNLGLTRDLYQVDLMAGSAAAIISSATIVGVTANNFLGPLQLGPDCKIYVGRYNTGYLGVIDNPEVLGAGCNYNDTGVYLGGQMGTFGLPNQVSFCGSTFSFSGTCLGDSTNFYLLSSSNLLGAQWNFDDPASGGNNISFVNNPVHYFSALGTYNVSVIKYYAAYSDTISLVVTINALPVISLGPDTSFCTGNNFIIQAGSGFDSYLWHDNSTDSVYSAISGGSYWVTVSQNGCLATDTISLNQIPCNIPTVSFLSSDTVFCDKKCLDFTDLSTNNPTSWQWSFPGAVPSVSIDQNPVNICYNAYGTFDVTLIACNAAGCDTLLVQSFITEYQLPTQPVITQSNDTLFCTPAFQYAWYNTTNPGTVISTNAFYVSNSGGSFFVIVGDSIGCQNSSAVFVFTGIDFIIQENMQLTIFPNPVDEELTILCSDSHFENDRQIIVYDVLGNIIYNHKMESNRIKIKLSQQTEGVYFIQLSSNSMMQNTKFVICHSNTIK